MRLLIAICIGVVALGCSKKVEPVKAAEQPSAMPAKDSAGKAVMPHLPDASATP